MASTASGRGRPAIVSKTDLALGDGGSAILRLVGDSDTVQIELPKSWSLDSLQRSATQSGGRTKVTFVLDGEKPVVSTNGHTNGSTPAPADAAPVTEAKATRTRATKKAATPDQPAAPATATATKTRRTRKTAAASPVSASA